MIAHLWIVFRRELSRNARRKGYLFATFGIPVVAFFIVTGIRMLSQSSTEEATAELEFNIKGITSAGYVDLSGLFPEPGPYAEEVMTPFADEAAAQAALEAGEIEVYYIIAADYAETGKVTIVVPQFSANYIVNGTVPIESMFFGQWVDQIDITTLVRLHAPSAVETIRLTPDTEEVTTRNEDADFMLVYGFAIIMMIALFSTNGYLMQSVIEEKETKLIEILISSVRPAQLLAGKILAMGVLGLLQVSAYVLAAIIVTQITTDSSAFMNTFLADLEIPLGKLPLALVYFVLAYLFFAAGFGAVGALSSSMSEGPNLTLLFVLPSLLPLYFMAAFVDNPNGTIPVIMSFFPLTAAMAMVMRIAITSVPFIQIVLSLMSLSLLTWGMLWLAGRLFQMHTLLAGTMPKLREIPKLLRA